MKKLLIIVGVILAVLVAAAVYLLAFHQPATAPDSPDKNEETAPTNKETSANEAAVTITITYSNNGFNPDEMTVKEGTKITIKNDSSRTLDFASDDHPTHLINSELNVGLIEPGESKSFTPSKGTWDYHDHLNANATGQIIVE